MAKAHSPTRTVKNTLETIKMGNGPAGAFSHSRMGTPTKAISGMERRMAGVPSSIQAEISMKANGKMTKSTARVHLPMRAGVPIQVSGKTVLCMGMATTVTPMVMCIKATLKRGRCMAGARTSLKTGTSTMAGGRRTRWKEKAFTLQQTETIMKGYFQMEN